MKKSIHAYYMNFLYGLEAFLKSSWLLSLSMVKHPMALGFFLGFFISTIVHLMILAEKPQHLRGMSMRDSEKAYQHLTEKHGLEKEMEHFLRDHGKFKLGLILIPVLAVFFILLFMIFPF